MTEEEDKESKSSYQRLSEKFVKVESNNQELTKKVNSLLDELAQERANRQRSEVIADISAHLNSEFKPTDEMNVEALKWIKWAWENPPKVKKLNALPTPALPQGGVAPPPVNPEIQQLDGKPIPDELKPYMAKRLDMEEHKQNATGGVM